MYVASVFPLLFLSCQIWTLGSCTAFTLIFSPVLHSSHFLVDWFSQTGLLKQKLILIDNHQYHECGRTILLVPVLLRLKFAIWIYLGAHLWCKCCANVVVPVITVKGQTEDALSSAYLVLGRNHSPSLCFTEPLANCYVHIIKILHMKNLILPLFIHLFASNQSQRSWTFLVG